MKGYSLVRVEVCHTCSHVSTVDTRMMSPFCSLHEEWVSPIGKCKAYRCSRDAEERYRLDEYNNLINSVGEEEVEEKKVWKSEEVKEKWKKHHSEVKKLRELLDEEGGEEKGVKEIVKDIEEWKGWKEAKESGS